MGALPFLERKLSSFECILTSYVRPAVVFGHTTVVIHTLGLTTLSCIISISL